MYLSETSMVYKKVLINYFLHYFSTTLDYGTLFQENVLVSYNTR